jgi:hypothetical protein
MSLEPDGDVEWGRMVADEDRVGSLALALILGPWLWRVVVVGVVAAVVVVRWF